jgi:hypothetical protein
MAAGVPDVDAGSDEIGGKNVKSRPDIGRVN